MAKRIITDLIKKTIAIYLFLSLIISLLMWIVFKHFEVSVISYVFLCLIIPMGIKRIIFFSLIFIILFIFFIFDIIKNKRYQIISVASIILLLGKIPCLVYTQKMWVELADILAFFINLVTK